MAIKILRFGNGVQVDNPVLLNEQSTKMVDVIWAEIGQREGANRQLSGSSSVLDQLLKEELELAGEKTTGLDNFRIHTQPVREAVARQLKLGAEYDGFINRQLHSFPVMKQQQGVAPRIIDGRPTFFTTEISLVAREDEDNRISNEQLSKLHPEWFDGTVVSQTARTHIFSQTSTEEAKAEQSAAMAERPLANLTEG